MEKGRVWFVMLLIIIFAGGMLFGMVVDRTLLKPPCAAPPGLEGFKSPMQQPGRGQFPPPEREMGDPFAGQLSLSEKQQKKVHAIMEKHKPEIRKIMDKTRKEMEALRNSVDEEIMKVLDKSQQKKFEQLKKNRPMPGPHGPMEQGRMPGGMAPPEPEPGWMKP
jgi:Spy/CpxP family protein refolding chaperone